MKLFATLAIAVCLFAATAQAQAQLALTATVDNRNNVVHFTALNTSSSGLFLPNGNDWQIWRGNTLVAPATHVGPSFLLAPGDTVSWDWNETDRDGNAVTGGRFELRDYYWNDGLTVLSVSTLGFKINSSNR